MVFNPNVYVTIRLLEASFGETFHEEAGLLRATLSCSMALGADFFAAKELAPE
jgi:hypothetical protein